LVELVVLMRTKHEALHTSQIHFTSHILTVYYSALLQMTLLGLNKTFEACFVAEMFPTWCRIVSVKQVAVFNKVKCR